MTNEQAIWHMAFIRLLQQGLLLGLNICEMSELSLLGIGRIYVAAHDDEAEGRAHLIEHFEAIDLSRPETMN